jgi:O-antigen/teichoic acid export membrane protein
MSLNSFSSLRNRYLETAKHTLVFSLGNLGNKLIAFVLLPIYTSYFSPADYGLLALISTTSSLLHILLAMGLSTSIYKGYFSADTDKQRKSVTSSSLFWLLGTGVLFLALIWPFAPFLANVLLDNADYAPHLKWMFATVVLRNVQMLAFSILRAQKRSWAYAGLSIANFLIGALLTIYFVVTLRQGVLGSLIASFITALLLALVGLILSSRDLRVDFSWQTTRNLLVYGSPLIVSGISSFILGQVDRYFLKIYSTMEQVGLYSLSYQIGMIINELIVQPFQLIWLPMVFESERQHNNQEFFSGALTYFCLFTSWIALGLSLFSKELLELVSAPAYHEAYRLVPWIAYTYILYGGYMVINIGIYLKNKTHYTIWIVGSAAVSNILLNFLLIPQLSSLGAAIATFISYIILFGISRYINSRLLNIHYQWRRLIKLLVINIVLVVMGNIYSPANLGLALLYKAGLSVLVFWALLFACRFFTREEINILQGFRINHFALKRPVG